MRNPEGSCSRIGMVALASTLILVVSALLMPGEAQAEERKFIVMLAHSHKQVGTVGDPGVDVNDVHQAYFAEDQVSFKRFWEEVSYGDVTIDGTTLPHGFLPWPLEAPDDVLDESNALYANGTIPYADLDRSRSFNYGVGEPFQEFEQPFEIDWDGNFNGVNDTGAPLADDDEGEELDWGVPPGVNLADDVLALLIQEGRFTAVAKPGLIDGVWTPGERFRDIDDDGRWDQAELSRDDMGACRYTAGGIFEGYDPTEVGLVVGTGEEGQVTMGDFCDLDFDGTYDPGEPWEDFLVRYDPTRPEGSRWVPVTEDYIRKNYPGDVDALIERMGNYQWDGPDSWTEHLGEGVDENLRPAGTTKLQHAGRSRAPGKTTPEPRWLAAMWMDRYGTLPPAWGDEVTGDAIPEIIPFDPSAPDPAIERVNPPVEELLRQFVPGTYDRGQQLVRRPAYNADLLTPGGDEGEATIHFSPRDSDELGTGTIQWDALGVYDGPAEFDDLASSIYHDPPDVASRNRYSCGDLRLGEVMSPQPTTQNDPNTPEGVDPVWGYDHSSNDPYVPTVHEADPDGIIWAAGPYAFRVHGNNLMDAGNQLAIELLTWRRDGQGTTLPSDDKLPLGALWRRPNPHSPTFGTYKDSYLGSLEPFDDFDGWGGYSGAETCEDLAIFDPDPETDDDESYGIRGMTVYDGQFYLANAYSGYISVIGEIVTPSPGDLPCDEPILNEGTIADTPVVGNLRYLAFQQHGVDLDDIQAIEFGPDGTFYAIDAASDTLVVVRDADASVPTVELFYLQPVGDALTNGITPQYVYITGLAWHELDGVLYAASNGTIFKMLFSIDTTAGHEGEYDIVIFDIATTPGGVNPGNVTGLAYNPYPIAGQTYSLWAVWDRVWVPVNQPAKAGMNCLEPSTAMVYNPIPRWNWSEYQFHDVAVVDAVTVYGVNALTAKLVNVVNRQHQADLTGPGVCLVPQDNDGDGEWDRRNEGFCDLNDNGRFDFAGFRDWNLDGLLDQGETIVAGAGNYLNDYDVSSSNDGVHSRYPFNRVRLLEDIVAIQDHEVDWTDYVAGGQLPDRVYSTTLVTPTGSAFGDVREFSPTLRAINTRDQVEPFDDANGDGEWQPGEPYTDVDGDGRHDYGQPIYITDLVGPVRENLLSNARVTAHEYGHFWEGYRDLYDIVAASQGLPNAGPVADWHIMATGAMVHPAPMHKELPGSAGGIQHDAWIDTIDLTTVLTPGVVQNVVVNSCELTRQKAYYVYRNPDRPAERFYFYRVSNDITMPDQVPSVSTQLPGTGLLIMHVDTTICGAGLCQQQPDPWVYKLVQADGLFQLQDGVNRGDVGDPFGNGSGVVEWLWDREDNEWNNGAVTGIEILAIDERATFSRVTFRWTPQDVPWLQFLHPPGGESAGGIYQIAYLASDRFGGTLTEFYMDGPYEADDPTPTDYDGPSVRQLCCYLGPDGRPTGPAVCGAGAAVSQVPKVVGTFESSFPVALGSLDNGDYFFYARLIPGEGQNGNFEQAASIGRPPRNANGNANTGNGWLTGTDDPNYEDGPANITPPVVDLDLSLLERWTVVCTSAAVPGAEEWTVTGSLSGPQELRAITGQDYSTDDGAVSFRVVAGDRNFAAGDRFIFRTTGKTAFSARVRVNNHSVSIVPTASFTAAPLTGGAPLDVSFDGTNSFDPESGGNSTLVFTWDFGDGSAILQGSAAEAAQVTHRYEEAGEFLATLAVESTISTLVDENPGLTIEVSENDPPNPCLQDIDPQGTDFEGDTSETPDGFRLRAKVIACPNADPPGLIDPDGDPVVVDWDFGDPFDDTCDQDCDGTADACTNVSADAEVCHAYRAAGTYMLTVTAREDTDNATQTVKSQQVEVTGNKAPLAVIEADPIGGPTPLDVTFSAIASSDPDNNIDRYDWHYGDGGTCADCGPGPLVYTYNTDAPDPEGYYTATLTVTDTLGVSETDTARIYAGNQAPTAAITTNPSPPTVTREEDIIFQATTNDPDGDPLDILWDFDDSNGVDPANPDATGAMVTHDYDTEGTYTVTLTVDDRKGGVDTDTVQVTVTRNDPPVARLTATPTSGGPPLTVNFDASASSDPETARANLMFTWDFDDGSAPVSGRDRVKVSHTYNAAAIYRPSVSVSDGVLTDTAEVEITVRTPPPSAPVASLSATPDNGPAPLIVTFDSAGTYDPDDDLATFLWEFGDGTIARESLATVTSVSHMYQGGGTFSARLTAFDMQGRSSVATVQVVVTGEPAGVAPPPAAVGCGFGAVETLALGLVSLMGLRIHGRRKHRYP
ncbi:MAG: PKD domain-containing protein [Phycisphaerales bacterium]|nr:MAG: PKD domain-containing protein [Phycisphaerales bacterium]